jgi:hypothetical protein
MPSLPRQVPLAIPTPSPRLIVHRSADSLLLCYVDHHDPAYQWAERRKLQTHPKTGAAQLVEIRETVHHIVVPNYTVTPQPQKPPLFATVSEDELLGFSVPPSRRVRYRAPFIICRLHPSAG